MTTQKVRAVSPQQQEVRRLCAAIKWRCGRFTRCRNHSARRPSERCRPINDGQPVRRQAPEWCRAASNQSRKRSRTSTRGQLTTSRQHGARRPCARLRGWQRTVRLPHCGTGWPASATAKAANVVPLKCEKGRRRGRVRRASRLHSCSSWAASARCCPSYASPGKSERNARQGRPAHVRVRHGITLWLAQGSQATAASFRRRPPSRWCHWRGRPRPGARSPAAPGAPEPRGRCR